MLEGLDRVAVGASSPIPAAAALLARERGGGRPALSLLGAEAGSDFTDGGRELFDRAGQGRIDAFFLGGVQIDGGADINLVGTGPHPAAEKRFPGSYGSAYLYFVVPRVVLFRLEHSPRTLVRKVDFVSAPGTSPPGVYRPGGPYALVTGRCVFPLRARARALPPRLAAPRPQPRRGARRHRLRLRQRRRPARDAGAGHGNDGAAAGAGRRGPCRRLSPLRRHVPRLRASAGGTPRRVGVSTARQPQPTWRRP